MAKCRSHSIFMGNMGTLEIVRDDSDDFMITGARIGERVSEVIFHYGWILKKAWHYFPNQF